MLRLLSVVFVVALWSGASRLGAMEPGARLDGPTAEQAFDDPANPQVAGQEAAEEIGDARDVSVEEEFALARKEERFAARPGRLRIDSASTELRREPCPGAGMDCATHNIGIAASVVPPAAERAGWRLTAIGRDRAELRLAGGRQLDP